MDASFEELYTKVPGLEHKYRDTALLLVNDVCGAYCRFCFRKRLFMNDNDEVVKDVSNGVRYIREHPEISNVLLTGGDPLIMSTSKLEPVIAQLRDIPHVKIIRIGTKMPAFNPYRILNDPSLWRMLETYSTTEARIYIMAHFNHPVELTAVAREGLDTLHKHGAIIINQSPMIRGVNDSVQTMLKLFNELSYMGVPPYYVFQCRPTEGNKAYSIPIEKAYQIFGRGAEPVLRTRQAGAFQHVACDRKDRSGGAERIASDLPIPPRCRPERHWPSNGLQAQQRSPLVRRLRRSSTLSAAQGCPQSVARLASSGSPLLIPSWGSHRFRG